MKTSNSAECGGDPLGLAEISTGEVLVIASLVEASICLAEGEPALALQTVEDTEQIITHILRRTPADRSACDWAREVLLKLEGLQVSVDCSRLMQKIQKIQRHMRRLLERCQHDQLRQAVNRVQALVEVSSDDPQGLEKGTGLGLQDREPGQLWRDARVPRSRTR